MSVSASVSASAFVSVFVSVSVSVSVHSVLSVTQFISLSIHWAVYVYLSWPVYRCVKVNSYGELIPVLQL